MRGAHQLLIASGLLLTVSCASLRSPFALTPNQTGLAADDLPAAYSGQGTVPAPEHWWTAFGSEELNGLMTEAFAGNLDLAQAWARLRQAESSVTVVRAQGSPQVTFSGSTSRTEASSTGSADSRTAYATGLNISYEVDLWGRIRAESQASELAAQATAADVRATALVLSGQIAGTWIDLRATQAELAVVAEQTRTAHQYLELLKTRQRKALSAAVDVYQQQQQVKALESAAIPLRGTATVLQLQLAYLVGKPPQTRAGVANATLPDLPPLPDSGLPAALLAGRPDIVAARLRLQAQEWTETAARADRLPTLALSGSGDLSSERLADVLDNWALNLVAGLTAPILDGGRRRAEVARNQALADERLLAYRDTVRNAILEVEQALAEERWRQSYLASLKGELETAGSTLEETQRRYLKGMTDYIPVLNALAAKQQAERQLVTARADLLTNRATLCQALGGSWLADLSDHQRN